METKMTLIEKISKIQKTLKAPKGQFNKFGKYNYRSCEDILEALKPLLNENKLMLTISDEIIKVESKDEKIFKETKDDYGKTSSLVFGGDRFYIKATATITDGETSISTSALAREADDKKGMDNSQLTGATSSYARKYALNGLFLIDDTEDSDDTNDQIVNDEEMQRIQQEVNEKKTDKELGEYYLANKDTVRNKAFFNKIVVAKKATFTPKP